MQQTLTRRSPGQIAIDTLRDYGAILGMLGVLALFYSQQPAFLSANNILNVLRQSTPLIAIALGMTIVMSMRGVDLSVAQIADASGLLAGWLIVHHYPIWTAYTLPLLLGLFVGLINGTMMAYIGIPAIIGTLGMMFILRSGELFLSNGAEPQILFSMPKGITRPFLFLGQGSIGPVSTMIILAIVIGIVVVLFMTVTPYARRARALGANVRAAFLAGIDIRAIFASGFVASGVLAALAGIAIVSRTGVAMPRGSESYLLDGFAAVFLGTLLSRNGEMNIPGTILGALFIGFLGNGLTIMGLGAPYRYALNGAFILLAMAIGGLKRKN